MVINRLPVTIQDVRRAAKQISPYIHRTPVITSQSLDSLTGVNLFFKCENLQRTGSFKPRGATNAVLNLSDSQASKGVATHSSGNFAQALALAARNRGIKAHIVMPRNAPDVKKNAVEGYGGEIVFCDPTLQSREETLRQVVEHTGATFIHPYNDPAVIAGQGTAAIELLEDIKDLYAVFAPVGGGGLCSGTAIAAKALDANIRIYGAEPENADDAYRSLLAGKIIPSVNPDTVADGLLTSLGENTFIVLKQLLKEIITVSEAKILMAMRLIFERTKLVVEPSAAVTLAAILTKPESFINKRVGLILSGGNISLKKMSRIA